MPTRPRATGQVDVTEDFQSPLCLRLYDYWRGRRPADGAPLARPAWRDIQLIDIHQLAPKIMVRDVIDGGAEFRHRYWGTDLTFAFGFDGTGLLVGDILTPESQPQILELCRTTMTATLPVRMRGLSYIQGKDYLSFEAIFLPLSGTGGDRAPAAHLISLFDFDF